jgi:hypothetical protein
MSGIGLSHWAAATLDGATGDLINNDGNVVSGDRISQGVYELVMQREMGSTEIAAQVTPCYEPGSQSAPDVHAAYGLQSDGVTVTINIFDGTGAADASFCIVVSRFTPP